LRQDIVLFQGRSIADYIAYFVFDCIKKVQESKEITDETARQKKRARKTAKASPGPVCQVNPNKKRLVF